MNNITIICIIVVIVMSEDRRSEKAENGSFRNQTEEGLVYTGYGEELAKRYCHFWKGLKQRSAPRGNPKAGSLKRQSLNRARNIKLTGRIRKTASDFSEIANKELESLAQHMPNLSDIDTRTLALRMYYIELSEGISRNEQGQQDVFN